MNWALEILGFRPLSHFALVASPRQGGPNGPSQRIALAGILDEFFVDPATSVAASPNLSENESAGNRPTRNYDVPEVPDVRPGAALESKMLTFMAIYSTE
jgi:hypothetical protein